MKNLITISTILAMLMTLLVSCKPKTTTEMIENTPHTETQNESISNTNEIEESIADFEFEKIETQTEETKPSAIPETTAPQKTEEVDQTTISESEKPENIESETAEPEDTESKETTQEEVSDEEDIDIENPWEVD